MKKNALLLFLLLTAALPLAAQMPKPDAQLAAMKKLDYLAGTWRGEGWIQMGGPKLTFKGGETVQRKLNGVALLVEGAFTAKPPGSDVEIPVHTTLGVIAYDPKTEKYGFATWLATGGSGTHELTLTSDGWYWELDTPRGRVRYTFQLVDGDWFEIGEGTKDGGKTWNRFFEMRLKKQG